MYTEETIKNKARAAFEKENYKIAFSILTDELDVKRFYTYVNGSKRQWLTDKHPKAANYFWKTFVLKEKNFQKLFSSDVAVELLHLYYTKSFIFSKDFELQLSNSFPQLFIKAIRVNQVFLKKEHIDFLLEEIQLPENLQLHQDVWEYFFDTELELWKAIEDNFKKITNYPLTEILIYVVNYIEEQSFNHYSREFITQLADTYSFFMELLLTNYDTTNYKLLNEDDFIKSFVEHVMNEEESVLKKTIYRTMNLIYNRSSLFSTYVDPYSFELDTSPKIIYESLHFVTKPEANYRWWLDGIRYNVTDLFYRSKGIDFVQELIDNETYKPIGGTKEIQEANRTLQEKTQGILKILNDLQLSEYYLNKKDTIEVSKIIPLVITYAYNRLIKYQIAFDELRENNDFDCTSWVKTFSYLNLKSFREGTIQMPFVYMTQKQYAEMNKRANADFDDIKTKIIVDSFGCIVDNTKVFDRYNRTYDVFSKPYIQLKDFIFCPVQLFVAFSFRYVYVDMLIKNNGRRTAKKIEEYIALLLEAHDFNVFVPSKEQEKVIQGDADIIIYDDHQVLLMQLKRTYLRVHPRDLYNEYLQTDIGGAIQLNEAEDFFSTNTDIFDIKDRKVTKWIVSSSLENINRTIHGCLKVNYLDVVSFLFNQKGMTFKTLDDFISFYTGDNLLQVYLENVDETYSIKEPSKSIIPVFDYDVEKARKYRYLYDKGLKLNKKEKNKKSIAVFKKCLYYESTDVEVHGAIANVYADMEDYKNAFYHFEKALELLPNDPFITRNYILALYESGNYVEVIALTEKLLEKYPLLKEVQELAINVDRLCSQFKS